MFQQCAEVTYATLQYVFSTCLELQLDIALSFSSQDQRVGVSGFNTISGNG